MARVASLHVYPIKSLGGDALESSAVEPRGLRHDRRWMLVDEEGVFRSQRTIEQMALFRVHLQSDSLRVVGPRGSQFGVPFGAKRETLTVKVWGSEVEAVRVSEEADAWFTEQLERPCRLVYMPDETIRPTHPQFTLPGDHVGFADAMPVLVASQASLDDLNERLKILNDPLDMPLPMNRFRPNIVVEGTAPYAEDTWKGFTLGGIRFRHAKQCGRCRVTTTNQETGEVGQEPLRTLATYRRGESAVLFGTYYVPEAFGTVAVGDELMVEP
ncbi:MAG: MOSC domain-containing protein [Fimbriimonas sp.]